MAIGRSVEGAQLFLYQIRSVCDSKAPHARTREMLRYAMFSLPTVSSTATTKRQTCVAAHLQMMIASLVLAGKEKAPGRLCKRQRHEPFVFRSQAVEGPYAGLWGRCRVSCCSSECEILLLRCKECIPVVVGHDQRSCRSGSLDGLSCVCGGCLRPILAVLGGHRLSQTLSYCWTTL